jgi:hypothetical protein
MTSPPDKIVVSVESIKKDVKTKDAAGSQRTMNLMSSSLVQNQTTSHGVLIKEMLLVPPHPSQTQYAMLFPLS